MLVGHIYYIDLVKTHASYVSALNRFLNTFSPQKNWAVEAKPNATLGVAIRDGVLDRELHARFIQKTGAVQIHVGANSSQLLFPDTPYGVSPERIAPGDIPRKEGEDVTKVGEEGVAMIEDLKSKIDEAHGR